MGRFPARHSQNARCLNAQQRYLSHQALQCMVLACSAPDPQMGTRQVLTAGLTFLSYGNYVE